jgi:hypothetical protein
MRFHLMRVMRLRVFRAPRPRAARGGAVPGGDVPAAAPPPLPLADGGGGGGAAEWSIGHPTVESQQAGLEHLTRITLEQAAARRRPPGGRPETGDDRDRTPGSVPARLATLHMSLYHSGYIFPGDRVDVAALRPAPRSPEVT